MAKFKSGDSRQSVDLKWKLRKTLENSAKYGGPVVMSEASCETSDDELLPNSKMSVDGGYFDTPSLIYWGPILEVKDPGVDIGEEGSQDDVGCAVILPETACRSISAGSGFWIGDKSGENGCYIQLLNPSPIYAFYKNGEAIARSETETVKAYKEIKCTKGSTQIYTYSKGEGLGAGKIRLGIEATKSSSENYQAFVEADVRYSSGTYTVVTDMPFGTTSDDVGKVRVSVDVEKGTITFDLDQLSFPSGYTMKFFIEQQV